jgi:hypothetical protein
LQVTTDNNSYGKLPGWKNHKNYKQVYLLSILFLKNKTLILLSFS